MIDIEKTLEDLKLLNAFCHGTVLDDAIELLMKRKPKPVNVDRTDGAQMWGGCPWCETLMRKSDCPHYCGYCGQAVKWE